MSKILAMEIEKNQVKVLEAFIKSAENIEIVNFSETSTPTTLDDPSIVMLIKDLLKSGEFKARKAIVGLPKEDLVTRIVELPNMPAKDTYKIIRDEFYTYRAFKDDYAVISYFPVSIRDDRIKYLTVGSKRTVILRWLSILKKSGLKTIILEDSSVAAYRAVRYLYKEYPNDKQWCFIQVSPEETAIFISQGEELLFYRSFSYGEKDISQAEGFLQWLREINNTFSFFSKEFAGSLSNTFINKLPDFRADLLESLKNSTGISSEFINLKSCVRLNFSKVNLAESAFHNSSLLGLTLSKIDSRLPINLIPEDIKNKGKNIFKVFAYSLITLSLLAGFSFLGYYLQTNRQETASKIEVTTTNISALSGLLAEYLPVENEFNHLKQQDDNWKVLINKYSRKEVYKQFSGVFAKLTGGIIIESFSFDGEKNIHLTISSPGFEPAYRYRDALINTNLFTTVVIRDFSQVGAKYLSSMELILK
ncbi:MAG: hypothetical protein DDT40_00931 [candidate division WS2 bacterium]|nr:hypothetical protein [Candidatus Psychracetigena formicireducens]